MADTILLVEDEKDVLEMLAYQFQKAGYRTLAAADGQSALGLARDKQPSLVVLDLMLPELDGTEVCKRLKADVRTSRIPILMLTAKGEEIDRIVGLELGAEDYVTKPFSPRELLLRVKAILRRRAEPQTEGILESGMLRVDVVKHEATVEGKAVALTATEFKLLSTLMERRGRVQTRDRLLTDVWGYESDMDTRTVDTHMRRLREKLGRAARRIETVRGVGYRFADEG